MYQQYFHLFRHEMERFVIGNLERNAIPRISQSCRAFINALSTTKRSYYRF